MKCLRLVCENRTLRWEQERRVSSTARHPGALTQPGQRCRGRREAAAWAPIPAAVTGCAQGLLSVGNRPPPAPLPFSPQWQVALNAQPVPSLYAHVLQLGRPTLGRSPSWRRAATRQHSCQGAVVSDEQRAAAKFGPQAVRTLTSAARTCAATCDLPARSHQPPRTRAATSRPPAHQPAITQAS
jgi:hypothetical protein